MWTKQNCLVMPFYSQLKPNCQLCLLLFKLRKQEGKREIVEAIIPLWSSDSSPVPFFLSKIGVQTFSLFQFSISAWLLISSSHRGICSLRPFLVNLARVLALLVTSCCGPFNPLFQLLSHLPITKHVHG